MLSNIEIARAAKPKPIVEVARGLGIPDEAVYNYGPYKAKIDLNWLNWLERPDGRLILVTAVTPTTGRRGQDHHHRRPRRRAQPHRQEGGDLPPRAVARAVLRHEGRSGGRRLQRR